MFNKIKRVVALVMVLAMALCAAACDEGGTGGGNTGGGLADAGKLQEYAMDTDALIQNMPAELKGTTIKFANWYKPDDRGEEGKVIDDFEAKSGCKVELVYIEHGDFNNQLVSKIQTDDAPDVTRMKRPNVSIIKFLQPVDVTGFDFSDKAWDKTTMDLYTFKGKCYGMNLVYTPFFLPTLLYYNTGTMEEMGYDDPWELWKKGEWTWEKLREMCKDWVKQGETFYGAALWRPVAETVNKNVVAREGDYYKLNLTDPLTIKTWNFQQDGRAEGVFINLNDGFDQNNQTLLFGCYDVTAAQSGYSSVFQKTFVRKKLAVVPYPKWENEEYYLPVAESIGYGIPKGAKNPKAVPYLVAYMCNMANYNTEGTNFFISDQAKEVYLQTLLMDKRSTISMDDILTFNGDVSFVYYKFFMTDSTNFLTELQTNEYVYQNIINQYNATIDSL